MRLFLLLAAWLATATLAQAAPPLEAYAEPSAVELMSLSPSGQRIAQVGLHQGERKILLRPPEGPATYAAPLGGDEISWIDWAGDDFLLIASPQTVGGEEDHVIGLQRWTSVIVLNTRTQQTFRVFAGATGLIDAAFGYAGTRRIDGRWYGLFGGVSYSKFKLKSGLGRIAADLYRVDLETGAAERMSDAEGGSAFWAVGPAGELVARIKSDLYDRSRSLMFGGLDTAMRTWNTSEAKVDMLGVGADERSVVVAERVEGRTIFHTFGPDGRHAEVSVAPETQILSAPVSRLIIGRRDADRVIFDDPGLAARWQATMRAFPGLRVELSGFSTGFDQALVRTTGPKDSGTFWYVDLATKRALPLASQRPQVPNASLGEMRRVNYAAGDGLALDGVLTLPAGRPAKALALVVLPQTLPQGWVEPDAFDPLAQAFASRGYAAFRPNPRGSGGHGEAFKQKGVGEVGRRRLSDISEGVAALAAEGLIDPGRVCIFGERFGGYEALAAVTLQKGIYRCAVAAGAPSNLASYGSSASKVGEDDARWRKRYEDLIGPTDGENLKAISPFYQAKAANAPVLLIHQARDAVVEPDQSRWTAKAIRAAGQPADLLIVGKPQVSAPIAVWSQAVLNAAVGFVQKHNPPD